MSRRGLAAALVAGAIAFGASGCGEDEETTTTPVTGPEASAPFPDVPGETGDGDEAADAASEPPEPGGVPAPPEAQEADPEQVADYESCLRENGFVPRAELIERAQDRAERRDERRDEGAREDGPAGSGPGADAAEPDLDEVRITIPPADLRRNALAIESCQGGLPDGYPTGPADGDTAPGPGDAASEAREVQQCFAEALDDGDDPAEAAEECGILDGSG